MDGGVGDIWSTGAFSFESPLKDLLDSEQYTVEQLLEQDELLQELRGMHPTLVEFFSQDESVVKLIRHVIDEKPPPLPDAGGDLNGVVSGSKMPTEPPNVEAKEPEEDDWEVQKAPTPQYSERDVQVLRYPYMACEVICSEINAIVDTVVDGHTSAIESQEENTDFSLPSAPASSPPTILDLLFSILYNTEHGGMDDYRAGYFDKILSVLCRKRPAAMSTYINEGGGKGRFVLMQAMLKHLYSQSILQVVQRLMMPRLNSIPSNNEGDESSAKINDDDEDDDEDAASLRLFRSRWPESSEGIDLLMASLLKAGGNEQDYELNLAESQNASEVLITMIQNSPLISPVLLRLTQEPMLPQIMEAASTGDHFSPHDNSLTCAMNVLESLILQLGGYGSVNTDDNGGQIPAANADVLIQHLPTLLQRLKGLLRHESTKEWVSPMQFSPDPQPILGTSRLRIIRLVESLVLLGNVHVDELLCESEILQVCLDLFWEFEWNSMLHQSVANLLVHIFEGQNSRAILQKYFLVDCNLLHRLVESFEAEGEEGSSNPEPVDVGSNDGMDNLAEDLVLPVSDDDVDAALERQDEVTRKEVPEAKDDVKAGHDDDDDDDIERDPRDHSRSFATSQTSSRSLDLSALKDMLHVGADAPTHIPSLRKGYMGHVIIVCQALVHACTPVVTEGYSAEENGDYSENNKNGERSASFLGDGPDSQLQPVARDASGDRLIIADLITGHPMQMKWQDFVSTTLASETAIQSTPLGGFQASAVTIDPLHSHRPGPDMTDFNDDEYDDDDDDEDIPGSDVIDMDDNDIDIAASMMDALSLPKTREFNPNAFGSAGRGGGSSYMFDDPLGGGHPFDANFDDVVADNEDEDQDTTNRRASIDLDPPVIDLFAGNLAFDGTKDDDTGGSGTSQSWSNFASFDDAFAAPLKDPFPLDESNPAAEPFVKVDDIFATEEKKSMDDIFGAPAPHDFLLDSPELEDDTTAALRDQDEEIPMTSHYPSSRRRAPDSDDDSSVDEDEPPPSTEDTEDEAAPVEESVAA
ncbi:hypothetical protein MHU86_5895 [Fragilaria crotonensis]|nr:hypothetical protein MHU86_5895 [Fragilaria crotonensis]